MVAFNEDTGDRIAWTKIEQLQKGRYEIVGYYDQNSKNLTLLKPLPSNPSVVPGTYLNKSTTAPTVTVSGTTTYMTTTTTTYEGQTDKESNRIIWLGKKIPQDRTFVRNQLRELNVWLYFSMVTLSLIGVFLAAFLIYFNLKYAHRR